MKCTIEIKMNNSAFQPIDDEDTAEAASGAELSAILRTLAEAVKDGIGPTSLRVYDTNGNQVGHMTISEE